MKPYTITRCCNNCNQIIGNTTYFPETGSKSENYKFKDIKGEIHFSVVPPRYCPFCGVEFSNYSEVFERKSKLDNPTYTYVITLIITVVVIFGAKILWDIFIGH